MQVSFSAFKFVIYIFITLTSHRENVNNPFCLLWHHDNKNKCKNILNKNVNVNANIILDHNN